MADSKMADSETNAAYNDEESPNAEVANTAASGIANDDTDHTYANVPPAPATANASSTPAASADSTAASSS